MPEEMDPKKIKKLEFAITTECEYLSIWLEEVLQAFTQVTGTDVWLVTDLSYIGEIIEDEDLEAIGKELGIPIKPDDLFIDVAKRLKKSRE